MSKSTDRILDLCRKVGAEHDSNKMADLIQQLNHELDESSDRLDGSGLQKKESEPVKLNAGIHRVGNQ